MTFDDAGDAGMTVVGIGASAGGLRALQLLLPGLSIENRMAYIVVQHSDPSQPTHLPDLLSACTDLPVTLLDDETILAPAHIYILRAGRVITGIDKGHAVLSERRASTTIPHTIDALFAFLAEAYGNRSIGVVLSGTGSDGERGMRAIKAASGTAFVQDPASADFPGMPQAVIDAGLADFVLEPEEIACGLIDNPVWRSQPQVIDETEAAEENDDIDGNVKQIDLHDLLEVLRKKTGFDLQHYRETTIKRRIDRRMAVHRLDQVNDYQTLLAGSDREAGILMQDVFINVTKFFRDQETFNAIRQAIRQVIKRKAANEQLRIWVPGCSTGEEAFSIAMQLAEEAGPGLADLKVQIFATDIDDGAIADARKSVYLAPQVEGLPPSLLERYFDNLEGVYRIKNELRDLVVFARHDLMQDPPFNHLDMISCRNVLIYFKRPMQERLISVFHYALEPGGYLVLGPSESVGRFSEQFETVEKRVKLFIKVGHEQLTPTVLDAAYSRPLRRLPSQLEAVAKPMSMEDRANALLVEGYGPAGVMVSQALKVEFVRGDVSRFLRLRPGDADLSVIDMAIDALRLEVRLVLQKAQRERIQIRGQAIAIKDALGHAEVTPIVVPTPPGSDQGNFSLLLFEVRELAEEQPRDTVDHDVSDLRVRELEHELAATREHLQTTIEELEASNEELQSMVEEFQSTTEELQSGNEELQTTNEELQSTNEELQTVNDEVKIKSEELSHANDDLQNILNVALSGVIVLDEQLKVSRYSAASRQIFKLWPTSIGQPFAGIESMLDLWILSQQIDETMRLGEVFDQIVDLGDKTYAIKLVPLVSDGRQSGLIITFDDVTGRRQLDADVRRLAAVVRDSNDAITVHGFDGDIQAWNRAAEDAYGFTEAEAKARNIFELVPVELKADYRAMIERLLAGEQLSPVTMERATIDQQRLRVQLTMTLLRDDFGKAAAIATTERLLRHDDA